MELGLKNKVEKSSLIDILNCYRTKQCILLIADLCIVVLAFLLSMYFTDIYVDGTKLILIVSICSIINITCLVASKAYSSIWFESADREILSITLSTIVYITLVVLIRRVLGYELSVLFYLLNLLFMLIFTIASRVGYRSLRRLTLHLNISSIQKVQNCSRVLIIGGGSAGSLIIRELYENAQLGKVPVGIIDDDKFKLGKKIHNVHVLGTCEDIKQIAKEYEIDEIILSIANISPNRKQEIISICKDTKCKLKKIPGIYEIIDGKVDIKKIKDVEIEDLLGRDAIDTNLEEISGYLDNKTILVTGGGGSIGSELCRQIANLNP